MPRMEDTQQFVFIDGQKGSRCNGGSRTHAEGLPRHAALAKKIVRTKHRDHSSLTRPIHHGEFYVALLNVHDALGRITLTVNWLVFLKFSNSACHSRDTGGVFRVEGFRLRFLDFHIGTENGATSIQRLLERFLQTNENFLFSSRNNGKPEPCFGAKNARGPR